MVMKLVTSNPRAISLYRISLIIPAWREHILVNILLVVLRYHFIGPAWVTCLCCCSVTKSCLPLCDPMDCSMPGFPVLHYLPVFAQTHVHWVSDAIQLSYPLSPPSPLALNPSQHQGLFQWVDSLHQVGKILELQLRHQSFQWMFRVDFL